MSRIRDLKEDVSFYENKWHEAADLHDKDIKLFQEKLDNVITAYEDQLAKYKKRIQWLVLEVQRLESENGYGYRIPGSVLDPYIDVSSLVDFPISSSS